MQLTKLPWYGKFGSDHLSHHRGGHLSDDRYRGDPGDVRYGDVLSQYNTCVRIL
jgi:hypothetical protein